MSLNVKNLTKRFGLFKDPNEKLVDQIKADVPNIVKEYVAYLVDARETKKPYELKEKQFAIEARDYICSQYAEQYPELEAVFPELLAVHVIMSKEVNTRNLLQFLTSILCVVKIDDPKVRIDALDTFRNSLVSMTNDGVKYAALAESINILNGRLLPYELPPSVPAFIQESLLTTARLAKRSYDNNK